MCSTDKNTKIIGIPDAFGKLQTYLSMRSSCGHVVLRIRLLASLSGFRTEKEEV